MALARDLPVGTGTHCAAGPIRVGHGLGLTNGNLDQAWCHSFATQAAAIEAVSINQLGFVDLA